VIAASIFDHPAVLLLIAFVTLVRWLISRAKSKAQAGQSPMAPPPAQPIARGGETQSEEERIRKFLEALGQPAGSAPPPKVIPRRPPITPRIFPTLPPLKTVPPPLPAEEAPAFVVPPLLPAQSAAPARADIDYQVQDFARQTSSGPAPKTRAPSGLARVKLGTPKDLRTAIVLREIFGPPRSLQPFDLTSGFSSPQSLL
jgi:hypothetical protein